MKINPARINKSMNTQKNDIERCAFVKGYNIIRARRKGRDLASIAMDEISQALKKGGLCKRAFHNRKYGYVNHKPTEREKIEAIFTKWGVDDPWGVA